MQFAIVGDALEMLMPPAAWPVAEFATIVQSRTIGVELEPIHSAPPPPAPVAVLPRNRQFSTLPPFVAKISTAPARAALLPTNVQRSHVTAALLQSNAPPKLPPTLFSKTV